MYREWLTRKVTVEEIESLAPLGFMSQEWKNMLAEMEPGDELWEFNSPPVTWECLAGQAGYCVVRNGYPVAGVLTVLDPPMTPPQTPASQDSGPQLRGSI